MASYYNEKLEAATASCCAYCQGQGEMLIRTVQDNGQGLRLLEFKRRCDDCLGTGVRRPEPVG